MSNWWEAAPIANSAPSAGGGGDWWSAAPVVAPKDIGRGEAFKRGAKQGITFGFGDEMAGVAAAGNIPVDMSAPGADLLADNPAFQDPIVQFGTGARDLATGAKGAQQRYEAGRDQARAETKEAETQYPWTTLGGNIVGGLAVPLPAIQGVKSAAAVGAGTSALMGFGTGEGVEDRVTQAATGAALGSVVGGGLGYVASRMGQPVARPANEVVGASERLGVSVPRAVASESTLTQRAGQGVRNVPGAGEAIVNAQARTVQGLDDAARGVSESLGSGERFVAGQGASEAISNWATQGSKAILEKAYGAVDNAVDPAVKTELLKTRQIASDILARRGAANLADESGAVSMIRQAVENGDGLTYEGIKTLRTSIGERMKNNLVGDMSEGELKQIYGALSDDLKTAVRNAGGSRAEALFMRANETAKLVADRRDQLAKIIGKDGSAPAEAVFDRIAAIAGEGGRGNIELLAKARKAIGQDEWNDVASAIVARLGRDANGGLTPNRFITSWGKMSDEGKSLLFSPVHRQALDDIATISKRMADVGTKFGNPSGTAQSTSVLATGAGFMTNPVATITALLGGNIAARILAAPATASSAAKWSRVYEAAVRKPTAATASALNIASRNLASTVSEKLGLNITADQIIRGLSGPRPSYAEPQQEKQRQ